MIIKKDLSLQSNLILLGYNKKLIKLYKIWILFVNIEILLSYYFN